MAAKGEIKIKPVKMPIILIDKKLERFNGKVLFLEKLKRANEILAG